MRRAGTGGERVGATNRSDGVQAIGKRRRIREEAAVALIASVALALVTVSGAAGGPATDGSAPAEGVNSDRLVVLLDGEPVASEVGRPHGQQAQAHRAELAEQRAEYRAWLRRNAPQARVVWEYDTALHGLSVELRGADPATLARGPGVRETMPPVWMSPAMNASLELVGWDEATGAEITEEGVDVGEGVAVGVIDTGIPAYNPDHLEGEPDLTHPFFAVTDANASFYTDEDGECRRDPAEFTHAVENWTEFTNCKVYVAKVFDSDDPDATPEALSPHGSHVAGTVAGNSATTDSAHDLTLSGVAPAAFLGNYNVFPGPVPEAASSDDIAKAVDEAVRDDMDVLNLSLGGPPPERGWTATELALRNARDAGVLAAVAAGNSGPGSETVEAPGRAPWVLTAGASTNPHFIGQEVSHEESGSAGAAVGDFETFPEDGPEPQGLVWWGELDPRGDDLACRTVRNADLRGAIALIQRGECTFTTKIRNAEDAGAGGVIVFNNVAGDPVAMAHDGTDPFPGIPAVMVGKDFGRQLVDHSGDQVTVGGEVGERDGTADVIAGFSSRGPVEVPGEGYVIKPDLTAPGVNVHSSTLCGQQAEDDTGEVTCGFAMFQGTSMASPHLAGSAAALLSDRDAWRGTSPEDQDPEARVVEAKSAITNSADDVVTDHVTGDDPVGVTDQGTGRLQFDAAWDARLYADPVSVSLGRIRNGNVLRVTGSAALLGDTAGAAVEDPTDPGLTGATVDAELVDGELTVTVARERDVRGVAEGYVTVTADGGEIRVPYWVRFG